jgi:hypothetical protein
LTQRLEDSLQRQQILGSVVDEQNVDPLVVAGAV